MRSTRIDRDTSNEKLEYNNRDRDSGIYDNRENNGLELDSIRLN